jgi:uncharacterized protein YndB with AHSA1/START domain
MASEPLRIERSVTLDAGPHEVYEVLADVGRRPEWLAELRRVEAPTGPVQVGTRFKGQSSLLFHDFVGTSEVVQAEPGRTLAEQVYLGARFVSEWKLDATPEGTRLRHTVAIDFPDGPLGRLERWVLRRRMAKMQEKSLAALASFWSGNPAP